MRIVHPRGSPRTVRGCCHEPKKKHGAIYLQLVVHHPNCSLSLGTGLILICHLLCTNHSRHHRKAAGSDDRKGNDTVGVRFFFQQVSGAHCPNNFATIPSKGNTVRGWGILEYTYYVHDRIKQRGRHYSVHLEVANGNVKVEQSRAHTLCMKQMQPTVSTQIYRPSLSAEEILLNAHVN